MTLRRWVVIVIFSMLVFELAGCDVEDSGGGEVSTVTMEPMDTPPLPPTMPAAAGSGSGVAWSAWYGGDGSEEMEGLWVTSDGGLIVTGSTDSFVDANGDAWAIRLDGAGKVLWQKTYGGEGDESFLDVRQTPDGGFITVGYTESSGAGKADFWVVKLTASGEIEWQKTYGGKKVEQAWSVALTSEGGYLVAGGTRSFGAGSADYWLLKLDAMGNVIWAKTYGGSGDDGGGGDYEEFVVKALVDRDGNYVVVSASSSFGSGETDYWVLKLAPDGSILWQKAYGGEYEESMWWFAEVQGGGYIIPGNSVSFSPDLSGDLWVLRLDPDGNIVWQRTYAIPGVWDEALTVAATSDGGTVVGGYLEEENDWDWYIFRLSADGQVLWKKRFEKGWDWPNAVRQMDDGSIVVAGVSWPDPEQPFDLWLTRMGGDGAIGASCDFLAEIEFQVADTNAVVKDTHAVVMDTPVTPEDSAAVVRDTSGHTQMLCTGP